MSTGIWLLATHQIRFGRLQIGVAEIAEHELLQNIRSDVEFIFIHGGLELYGCVGQPAQDPAVNFRQVSRYNLGILPRINAHLGAVADRKSCRLPNFVEKQFIGIACSNIKVYKMVGNIVAA